MLMLFILKIVLLYSVIFALLMLEVRPVILTEVYVFFVIQICYLLTCHSYIYMLSFHFYVLVVRSFRSDDIRIREIPVCVLMKWNDPLLIYDCNCIIFTIRYL